MNNIHYYLMKSHLALRKNIMNKVQEFGLTSGQPKILEYLYCVGKADQRTIAEHCEIEPATVGTILAKMQRDDLVIRSKDDGNRRSVFVTLTQKGKEMAVIIQKIFQQAEQSALVGVNDKEREKLCEILKLIYRNLRPTEDEND